MAVLSSGIVVVGIAQAVRASNARAMNLSISGSYTNV